MAANSNNQPQRIFTCSLAGLRQLPQDHGIFAIFLDHGKVRLATSQETDAMGEPTAWKVIDIDDDMSTDEIPLAEAILNTFVLIKSKERLEDNPDKPAIAFLHPDNSRIVVCGQDVFCEVAEEIQGITQWRKAPNTQVAFDILTTYVMSVANG